MTCTSPYASRWYKSAVGLKQDGFGIITGIDVKETTRRMPNKPPSAPPTMNRKASGQWTRPDQIGCAGQEGNGRGSERALVIAPNDRFGSWL
jgi:hypothetical protein